MVATSPMAWLLERAATIPAKAGNRPITEFQIWTLVEDNQRAVKAERPDAPSYVQQYLAERRTFVDLWGPEELHLFPGPSSAPSVELAAVTSSPSMPLPPPTSRGLFLMSSTPGVHPYNGSSVGGPTTRRPLAPSTSHDRVQDTVRDAYMRRSRSRSPRRRDDLYPRRDWDRPARSRSPRRDIHRDYRYEDTRPFHDIYPHREGRYRSPSPLSVRRQRRTTPPQKNSWQALAEKAGTSPFQLTTHRYTFPTSEIRPNVQDGLRTSDFAMPKPHIDTRTGKPYPPLIFTDPQASIKLLGTRKDSLIEIGRFFPAVVFQLEESKSPNTPATFKLWLEVKSSSDPLNQGVKWQIDACRRGLEAYQKKDTGSLPSVKNFYYDNRRLFHHGHTQQGLYLQSLARPRSHRDFLGQVDTRQALVNPGRGSSGGGKSESAGNGMDIQGGELIKRER